MHAYLQQFGFEPEVLDRIDPGPVPLDPPLGGELRYSYERIRELIGRDDARLIADLLHGIANATDGVIAAEARTARRLLALAGVPQADIDAAFDPEARGDPDAGEPWAVLDLAPRSSLRHARRRRLELQQVYAPERCAPLGARQMRKARERLEAVNEAWNAIASDSGRDSRAVGRFIGAPCAHFARGDGMHDSSGIACDELTPPE